MLLRTRPTMMTHHGQIAVGFIVLIGLVFIFVNMTVNLGQMAQVRAAVSNSADAGALAGASWIASGENEAAAIAKKMFDGILMIQAVYLVPFCPDREGETTVQDYANSLWAGLAYVNIAGFKQYADDILEAAWNIGRRETFTAVVNNTLMRTPCQTDEAVARGAGPIEEQIRLTQEGLEHSKSGVGIGWTNCLPSNDPNLLIHLMMYELAAYPDAPPTLQMSPNRSLYFQYIRGEDLPQSDSHHFDCNFTAKGIWGGPPVNGVPVAMPPGGVSEEGQKNWDIDLARVYPGVDQMNYGDCPQKVCGMEARLTDSYDLRPGNIQGGGGHVTVQVTHRVYKQDGWETNAAWPGWSMPIWETRFRPVGAEATADYTAAQVPSSNAKATLSGAR